MVISLFDLGERLEWNLQLHQFVCFGLNAGMAPSAVVITLFDVGDVRLGWYFQMW